MKFNKRVGYWTGKKLSPEHIANLIKSRTGKKHSAEWKINMSKGMTGISKSNVHKRKLSDALKGNKNATGPKSEAHKFHLRKPKSSRGRLNIKTAAIFAFEKGTRVSPMKGKYGEENHQWLGGKSFEPYSSEFNKRFKNLIRKRDNQVCQNCSAHREKLTEALHVHHINYDKELTILENCISLCRSCHSLTQINREYWTKLFQDKLSEIYNYKYDKENIILQLKGGSNE